jgi:hypothetical protein
MGSGRHTVLIDLGSAGGLPSGTLSIDGGGRKSFCGWINLVAQLATLMPDAGVEGGVDQVGDRVEDHDEEGAVERNGHDRREVELLE